LADFFKIQIDWGFVRVNAYGRGCITAANELLALLALGFGNYAATSPDTNAFRSATFQANRPLILTGRIGPFSKHAHFLRVWLARFR
jgi:hypothetical protein